MSEVFMAQLAARGAPDAVRDQLDITAAAVEPLFVLDRELHAGLGVVRLTALACAQAWDACSGSVANGWSRSKHKHNAHDRVTCPSSTSEQAARACTTRSLPELSYGLSSLE